MMVTQTHSIHTLQPMLPLGIQLKLVTYPKQMATTNNEKAASGASKQTRKISIRLH